MRDYIRLRPGNYTYVDSISCKMRGSFEQCKLGNNVIDTTNISGISIYGNIAVKSSKRYPSKFLHLNVAVSYQEASCIPNKYKTLFKCIVSSAPLDKEAKYIFDFRNPVNAAIFCKVVDEKSILPSKKSKDYLWYVG